MAESINIFVRSDESIERFVQALESLLGVTFKMIRAEEDDRLYEYRDARVAVTVHDTWGYVNDRELHFEDYQFVIGVRNLNLPNWGDLRQVRDEFARTLFEQLKGAQRYGLLMVYKMRIKLAAYDPAHEHGASTRAS
jgi:hypothetical protein